MISNSTKATTGALGAPVAILFWYAVQLFNPDVVPPDEVVVASTAVFTLIVQSMIDESGSK